MELNPDGNGYSSTDFTDSNIGTISTKIGGRTCPDNVYIYSSNKFSTGNCLYYTPEFALQSLDADGTDQIDGLNQWNNYDAGAGKWYKGNIKTCSDIGMRLPTLYETETTTTSGGPNADDGDPTFAQGNGVPSTNWTLTSTVVPSNFAYYHVWNGESSGISAYNWTSNVICVLP